MPSQALIDEGNRVSGRVDTELAGATERFTQLPENDGRINRETLTYRADSVSSGRTKSYATHLRKLDGGTDWVRVDATGDAAAHMDTGGWIEAPVDPDPA